MDLWHFRVQFYLHIICLQEYEKAFLIENTGIGYGKSLTAVPSLPLVSGLQHEQSNKITHGPLSPTHILVSTSCYSFQSSVNDYLTNDVVYLMHISLLTCPYNLYCSWWDWQQGEENYCKTKACKWNIIYSISVALQSVFSSSHNRKIR